MSNTNSLPVTTLKRLVHIITMYARIDTNLERLGFLESAGLTGLQTIIPLEGSKQIFAETLIRECYRVGQFNRENKSALDLLLEYLLDVVSGNPDEAAFLKSLHTSAYNFDKSSPDLEKQLAHYRAKMIEWHGTTRILGRSKPLLLDKIYTQVHIWEEAEAQQYFTETELEKEFRQWNKEKGYSLRTRLEGIEVAKAHQKLFILGKPGSGKTTFMKWITLSWGKEEIEKIPIFITLKEMADAKRTVQEQIVYQFGLTNILDPITFAESVICNGNAIILFDGLDEVPGEEKQQERIIRDILDFVRCYGQNRFIVTCRTASITRRFQDFVYVEITDFNDEQITNYIYHYFSPNTLQAEGCINALHKREHKNLRDLATSILLLSLFCLNYEKRGTFPSKRADLYNEALSALLKRWNEENFPRPNQVSLYKQLSYKQRDILYQTLAYQNFKRDALFIKTETLSSQIESFLPTVLNISELEIDGIEVLKDMESQHGIIVERARGIYAFSHLTFQEYYTAKYIADNQSNNSLDELMSHITDQRWREVFLLTVYLVNQADKFFDKFIIALNELANQFPGFVMLLKRSNTREHQHYQIPLVISRLWDITSACVFALIQEKKEVCLEYWDLKNEEDEVIRESMDSDYEGINSGYYIYREFTKKLSKVESKSYEIDRIFERVRSSGIDISQRFGYNGDLAEALNVTYCLAPSLDNIPSFKNIEDLSNSLSTLKTNVSIDICLFAIGVTLQQAENINFLINHIIHNRSTSGRLITELKDLHLHTASLDYPTLQRFRQRVAILALKYWDLNFYWNFSKVDIEQIIRYLNSTTLFAECLNLAVVTDREGIKNRLLLPPGATPS